MSDMVVTKQICTQCRRKAMQFCTVIYVITGVDLDDCRDAESGAVASWAQKILDRVQEGYIEASPSGTGVHIIVEGTVRDGRTRKDVHVQGEAAGRVEMYGRGKFFTMTGETL